MFQTNKKKATSNKNENNTNSSNPVTQQSGIPSPKVFVIVNFTLNEVLVALKTWCISAFYLTGWLFEIILTYLL